MSERNYWERHAQSYDRATRIFARPLTRAVQLTVEAVAGNARVLEVAAGTGQFTIAIAKVASEVVTTDYAGAMIERLKARVRESGLSNVHCEQADLYALRFDAPFDAVVAANVLHLVPDLAAALAALRRALRPGGRLIVPTFCHNETMLSAFVSRIISLSGFPGHRRFTTPSLRDALERAGLEIRRMETLPGVIPIGYIDGTFKAELETKTP